MDILRSLIDVSIVTFIFYKMIMVVQGTRAIQILKGTAVILAVWVISGLLGFETLKFITSQVILYGLLGVIIIFQPELRNALERLGRQNLFFKQAAPKGANGKEKFLDDLVNASEYLSKRQIGALISIELKDSLQEYSNTGIALNATISKELLANIFTPNVPLHDGALIIRNNTLEAAGCYLPLSESQDISKELGTRHRAAIGLSEVTDAVTVIVSEETGAISLTKDSVMYRDVTLENLRTHLSTALETVEIVKPQKGNVLGRFKPWRKG